MTTKTHFYRISIGFILFNIALFLFISAFHALIPFHTYNYDANAHHYREDERILARPFKLVNALAQYDAQWYLKIAEKGYPYYPSNTNMKDKSIMDGLTYAFFPLYPLVLKTVSAIVGNIELTAFLLSSAFLLLNFLSLYFVVTRLYSSDIAIKTSILLFTVPFSIFYRSYFSEVLFLFLLIWFAYFFIKKKWLPASFLLSLLTVTRPLGLYLLPVFFAYLFIDLRHSRITLKRFLITLMTSILPFSLWLLYCFVQTGNPFYFVSVQSAWFASTSIFDPLLKNLNNLIHFFELPIHNFHDSRIDIVVFFYIGIILFYSRKLLVHKLWWISLSLWLFPLLTKDFISYSRYQIVSFPIFIYLAKALPRSYFMVVTVFFTIALFAVSLYFVNWWWVG